MDYLASNLDWLQEKLEALQAGKLHGAANMLSSQACPLSGQQKTTEVQTARRCRLNAGDMIQDGLLLSAGRLHSANLTLTACMPARTLQTKAHMQATAGRPSWLL